MVLPYTSNASTRYVVSVWAGGLSVKDASSTREARVPRELRLGPSQVSNHRLFCLFGGTWGAAHGHYCIGACTTASLILRIGSGAEAEKRVRQGVGRERALPQKQTNKQTNSQKKVLILLLVPPSPSSSFLHTAPPPLGHLPPLPEMSATDLPVFVTARWAAPGQEKTKVAPDNVALMSPPPDAFAVEVPAGTTQIGERAFDDVVSFQAHLDQNWDDDGAHAGSDRCTRKGLCEVILPRAAG